MTTDDRLRRVREFLRDTLAAALAAGPDDSADDGPADVYLDAADRAWEAVDEDGRHAMRWGAAALQVIERACRRDAVAAPPWLNAGSTPVANRAAMAAFFGAVANTPPADQPPGDAFDDWLRFLFRRAYDHPDGPRLIMEIPGVDLTRAHVTRMVDYLAREALLLPRSGEVPAATHPPEPNP